MNTMYKISLFLCLIIADYVLASDPGVSNQGSREYVLKSPNQYPKEDGRKIRAENLRTIREYKKALKEAKAAGNAEMPRLVWKDRK